MHQMLVIGNPSRRRKRRKSASRSRARRRHRKVARRSHRVARRRTVRVRARRNPIALGGVMSTVKAGALGAVGGLANDVLYGVAASKLAFLPQAGLMRNLAKVATALIVGKVGNMALRGKGGALANGAATVALHAALKDQLASMPFMASIPLGEYITGDAPLAAVGVSGYDAAMPVDGFADEQGEMGEYIDA